MSDLELDFEEPEESAPTMPVMELLPATVSLPLLARFAPDLRVREALNEKAIEVSQIDVRGAEGLAKADAGLEEMRECVRAVKAMFEEPTRIANELHKHLTSMRAEWIAPGEAAITHVSRRIYVEKERQKELEREARRKVQAEADEQARRDAQRRIDEAKEAEAAPEVIEQLQQEAEEASAPPVHIEPTSAPLQSSTVVENWTSTVKGTPRDAEEQQPSVEDATEAQREQLKVLMSAIVGNTAPVVCCTWNWKAIDKLAKAGKSSFKVPGIDSYDKGGLKAKPRRGKK
jgi:hypothetical protein